MHHGGHGHASHAHNGFGYHNQFPYSGTQLFFKSSSSTTDPLTDSSTSDLFGNPFYPGVGSLNYVPFGGYGHGHGFGFNPYQALNFNNSSSSSDNNTTAAGTITLSNTGGTITVATTGGTTTTTTP